MAPTMTTSRSSLRQMAARVAVLPTLGSPVIPIFGMVSNNGQAQPHVDRTQYGGPLEKETAPGTWAYGVPPHEPGGTDSPRRPSGPGSAWAGEGFGGRGPRFRGASRRNRGGRRNGGGRGTGEEWEEGHGPRRHVRRRSPDNRRPVAFANKL